MIRTKCTIIGGLWNVPGLQLPLDISLYEEQSADVEYKNSLGSYMQTTLFGKKSAIRARVYLQ